MQGCLWVELRDFFNLTHYGGLKKIQPNSHGTSWTHGLGIFLIIIIIIIIKLSIITISSQIRANL